MNLLSHKCWFVLSEKQDIHLSEAKSKEVEWFLAQNLKHFLNWELLFFFKEPLSDRMLQFHFVFGEFAHYMAKNIFLTR